MELVAEKYEQKFALKGYVASTLEIDLYQRLANTQRRVLETLGVNRGRIPKDVNQIEAREDAELLELFANAQEDA
jgi:hypothetical protein